MYYGIAKTLIPNHIRYQMIDLIDDLSFHPSSKELPHNNVVGIKADHFDNMFCGVQEYLLPIISEIWGKELTPTFNFGRIYYDGSDLFPHYDKESAEYAVTVNLSNEKGIWPLFAKYKDQTETQIDLNPGDGLYYKGLEVLHWRNKNVYGKCYQAMFFFVDKNGEYFDYEYDTRKKQWIESYNNPIYKLDI